MELTVLGELLIDFTQAGESESGMRLFEQNPGGAVANVAAAAARLGHSAAFIGKVGNDMHGRFLAQILEETGIDCRGLVFSETAFTTLAFVALDEKGERSFSFARKPGADTCLRPEELNRELLQSSRILHVGSLSLTAEPARGATLSAIRQARAAGAIISYDPNYRASLWESESQARAQMRSLLPLVDIMKLSDNETALLADYSCPRQAALALNNQGIGCVAVTLGAAGALVCVGGETETVPGFSVSHVRDTTGAGDAFWGGFLSRFLESNLKAEEIRLSDAAEFARWGNAAAACCIQKRGAIPAMPGREELERWLR
ncbi:MAG: carbohydrate kinase family protein [Candidatus Limivicinus sp.]